jgi:hypothetical protein
MHPKLYRRLRASRRVVGGGGLFGSGDPIPSFPIPNFPIPPAPPRRRPSEAALTALAAAPRPRPGDRLIALLSAWLAEASNERP